MATPSLYVARFSLFFFFFFFSFSHPAPSVAVEFTVGEETGWGIPPAKDSGLYNQWASENRFQIGDSLNFKYEKDSVMEVGEEEYEKCGSSHPAFFSNDGDTVFTFNRSGTFFFISGVAGHCQRGEKMIIQVMGHSDRPMGPSANINVTTSPLGPRGSSSGSNEPSSGFLLSVGVNWAVAFWAAYGLLCV